MKRPQNPAAFQHANTPPLHLARTRKTYYTLDLSGNHKGAMLKQVRDI